MSLEDSTRASRYFKARGTPADARISLITQREVPLKMRPETTLRGGQRGRHRRVRSLGT
jgi:hypothetical protein